MAINHADDIAPQCKFHIRAEATTQGRNVPESVFECAYATTEFNTWSEIKRTVKMQGVPPIPGFPNACAVYHARADFPDWKTRCGEWQEP